MVVHCFSKMAHCVPLSKLFCVPQLPQIFLKEIFCFQCLLAHIIYDHGKQFVSKFWRALCKILIITLGFFSKYHPQSNGQLKQINGVLKPYQVLEVTLMLIRITWLKSYIGLSLPITATSLSPHLRHSTVNVWVFLSWFQYSFRYLLLSMLVEIFRTSERRSSRIWPRWDAQAAAKAKMGCPGYKIIPGDTVWLYMKNIQLKVLSYKLASQFIWLF